MRYTTTTVRGVIRSGIAFIAGLALIGVPAAIAQASLEGPALGQRYRDIELVQVLTMLTVLKGRKNVSLNDACFVLGVGADREHCLVVHEVFLDEDGTTHSVSVLKHVDTVYTIIANSLVPFARGGSYYLLEMWESETPRSAARRVGSGAATTWSKLPVASREVRDGFAAELAYWRGKVDELAREPNRKD